MVLNVHYTNPEPLQNDGGSLSLSLSLFLFFKHALSTTYKAATKNLGSSEIGESKS